MLSSSQQWFVLRENEIPGSPSHSPSRWCYSYAWQTVELMQTACFLLNTTTVSTWFLALSFSTQATIIPQYFWLAKILLPSSSEAGVTGMPRNSFSKIMKKKVPLLPSPSRPAVLPTLLSGSLLSLGLAKGCLFLTLAHKHSHYSSSLPANAPLWLKVFVLRQVSLCCTGCSWTPEHK